MSRYIDVDKLQRHGKRGGVVYWRDIDAQPTEDVVEVVRCHDCKFAEVADANDSEDGYICQFHRGSIWFSGSYCSWGERKEA